MENISTVVILENNLSADIVNVVYSFELTGIVYQDWEISLC